MIIFWMGCITNSPTVPTSTVQINNLNSLGCSEGLVSKKEKNHTYCWDSRHKRIHGSSTYSLPDGIITFQYAQGSITQYSVKETQREDTEQYIFEFLRNDAPLNLVQDFVQYMPAHPNIQTLKTRLFDHGRIPYSDLISIPLSSIPCSSNKQLCIRGAAFSHLVLEEGTTKTIISQAPTTYYDEHTVGALDVQECMDACQCSFISTASAKLTWSQANDYCIAQQKRLPTEAELILFSTKNKEKHIFEEWTSDWYVPLKNNVSIEPTAPCIEESSCSKTESKTVLGPSGQRRGATQEEILSFRCISSTQADRSQKPTLLTEKPYLPPFTKVPTEKSWHKKDPTYRAMLKDSKKIVPLGYQDIYLLTETLWNIHTQNPTNTALYQLGTTHMGYPILALRISNTPTSDTLKPALLFYAGIHGNELMGTTQILDQIKLMLDTTNNRYQSFSHMSDLWFLPLVNPDGNLHMMRTSAASKMGRKNGRSTLGDCESTPFEGVDIQRNFPYDWKESSPSSTHYSGPSSLSEPESQAIQKLAQRYQFLGALSWHSPGNYVTGPYANEGKKTPSPDIFRSLAYQMLETEHKWPPKLRTTPKDPDMGTPEDWLFHTFGTYSYQVRIAKHNLVIDKYKEKYTEKYRYIWQQFLDAIHEQPSFHGVVMNGQKEPIVAQIRILGRVDKKNKFLYYEGEEWTSRPHDGYYHQLVPQAGVYEIEVQSLGYRKTRKRILVEGSRTQSNIIMRKAQ